MRPNWNTLNWILVVNWKLVEIIDWCRTGFSAIGAVLMQCQLRALDGSGNLTRADFVWRTWDSRFMNKVAGVDARTILMTSRIVCSILVTSEQTF